jgi:hypothetical protein
VRRFERWLRNEAVENETFFLPFAKALLLSLSQAPLVLAMDGSVVGRGCMTLMLSLVYKQRALPIAWIVAKRRNGHFPERIHIELITKVQRLVPDGARVVVLGDGELDGVDLQALVKGSGWEYVLRTSKTTTLTWEGEEFRFHDVTDHVAPGEVYDVPGVLFTQRKYGPVLAATWWRKENLAPMSLERNQGIEDNVAGFLLNIHHSRHQLLIHGFRPSINVYRSFLRQAQDER